jgi:hypothetical protein
LINGAASPNDDTRGEEDEDIVLVKVGIGAPDDIGLAPDTDKGLCLLVWSTGVEDSNV